MLMGSSPRNLERLKVRFQRHIERRVGERGAYVRAARGLLLGALLFARCHGRKH